MLIRFAPECQISLRAAPPRQRSRSTCCSPYSGHTDRSGNPPAENASSTFVFAENINELFRRRAPVGRIFARLADILLDILRPLKTCFRKLVRRSSWKNERAYKDSRRLQSKGTFLEAAVDTFRACLTDLRVSSLRKVAAVTSENENLPMWHSKHSHS